MLSVIAIDHVADSSQNTQNYEVEIQTASNAHLSRQINEFNTKLQEFNLKLDFLQQQVKTRVLEHFNHSQDDLIGDIHKRVDLLSQQVQNHEKLLGAELAKQVTIHEHVEVGSNALPDCGENVSSNRPSNNSSLPGWHPPHHSKSTLHMLAADADWECELEASIWDSCFLIGWKDHSYLDVFAHLSLTLLYIFVMSSMLYVLSDGFVENSYSPEVLDRLKHWRASQGHAISQLGDHASLASRVCTSDPALGTATNQQRLYENIQAYKAISYLPFIEAGPLVCGCCVSIYIMLLLVDIEKPFHKILAIWALRSSERTKMRWESDTCTLVCVHTSRCCVALLAFALRLFFNMTLLYFGAEWLVFTIDIPSLLLNTTALSFLLSTHSDMFETGSPHVLRVTMASLKPLRMPRFIGRQFMPLVFCLFGIGVGLFCFFEKLQPLMGQMKEAAVILCGGHLDFVSSGQNGHVGVHWTKTNSADVWKGHLAAIEALILNYDSDKKYAFEVRTSEETFQASIATMSQYVGSLEHCNDITDYGYHVGSLLYVMNDNATMKTYDDCSDLKEFCTHSQKWAQMMRVLCPVTCGCMQPDSGLVFLSSESQGCRQRHKCYADWHRWNNSYKISCRSCVDMPLDSLLSLAAWKTAMEVISRAGTFLNASTALAHSHISNFGCAGLRNLSAQTRSVLCDSYSIPFFCPEACECNPNSKSSDCPWNCIYPGEGYGGGCKKYFPDFPYS